MEQDDHLIYGPNQGSFESDKIAVGIIQAQQVQTGTVSGKLGRYNYPSKRGLEQEHFRQAVRTSVWRALGSDRQK